LSRVSSRAPGPRNLMKVVPVTQPPPLSAGVLQRHQSQIARDLLATLKSFGSADDQHKGQRGQCTHSGMRLQTPCCGTHAMADCVNEFAGRLLQRSGEHELASKV
jgi:hypothetical protein